MPVEPVRIKVIYPTAQKRESDAFLNEQCGGNHSKKEETCELDALLNAAGAPNTSLDEFLTTMCMDSAMCVYACVRVTDSPFCAG